MPENDSSIQIISMVREKGTPRIARREISPRTDSRRLLIAATAPLYHHAVLLRAPINTQLTDEAAHDTAVAAAAGASEGGAAADR